MSPATFRYDRKPTNILSTKTANAEPSTICACTLPTLSL
jgi:hypothetical protein